MAGIRNDVIATRNVPGPGRGLKVPCCSMEVLLRKGRELVPLLWNLEGCSSDAASSVHQ